MTRKLFLGFLALILVGCVQEIQPIVDEVDEKIFESKEVKVQKVSIVSAKFTGTQVELKFELPLKQFKGPTGGFNTIINNQNQNDFAKFSIESKSRIINGLDKAKRNCFVIEARYTVVVPAQSTRSDELCLDGEVPPAPSVSEPKIISQNVIELKETVAQINIQADSLVRASLSFGENSTLGQVVNRTSLSSNHSFNIKELKDNRLYYYQVMITNEQGKSTLSNILSFKTLKKEVPLSPPTDIKNITRSYEVDDSSHSNPDRGWYAYTTMLENPNYESIAKSGFRLVYSPITLKDFIARDISDSVLNTIKTRFASMRSAGVKAVLRVNYNETDGGKNANFDQIERHMKQLAPILEANKDVIAYIEGGYFGPWGEWHLYEVKNPPFLDVASTWKKLMELLLANKPKDRFIMIRYPSKKQEVFQGKMISANNAFSEDDIARLGHHNDCFLSSDNDVGTYQPWQTQYSNSITDLKNYLKVETRYSPMGGESCALHSRSNCSDALEELADLHFTYLNLGYFPGVINRWKSQGCFDEIDKRLGYRLELTTTSLPEMLEKGKDQTYSVSLKNVGFARPWYPRKAFLNFVEDNKIVAKQELSLDVRDLEPGMTKTFTFKIKTPNNLDENVDLALWLPDLDTKNYSNHRLSIRLSNKDVWSNDLGHNTLVQNLKTR